MIFSNDRIVSLLTNAFISTVLFISPWGWLVDVIFAATWVGGVWLFLVYMSAFRTIYKKSEQSVLYVSKVYYKSRVKKKKNLFGQLLDQLPPATTAAAYILNSHLTTGAFVALLWLISNWLVSVSSRIFMQLPEKKQKEFLCELKEF